MSQPPTLAAVLATAEADHIRLVMSGCDRVKEAAAILGIAERTLIQKRHKLGIPVRRINHRKRIRENV